MESEKTLELELELKDAIEIIDAGMTPEDLMGPDSVCCWGPYSPIRM
jgi:hypothetical protein